jgi:C1A family cysteine protease
MKSWQVAALLLITAIPLYYHSLAPVSHEVTFKEWMGDFGFSFSNEEEAFRSLIFIHNLEEIESHNSDNTQTYKKGVNQFTHLSIAEFKAMFVNRFYESLNAAKSSVVVSNDEIYTPVLQEIDWQALGKVSAVGNQGQCDAGYAFCSASLIESLYLIKGETVMLSEQQIVDCSANYTTFGCQSGSRNGTLTYIREKGLTTDSAYPYKGVKNNCQKEVGEYKPVYKHVEFNGCSDISGALSSNGPLTVAVNAADWLTYRAGIYNGCTSTDVNHDILLIGVNSESWRLKNSWGTRWGEFGYIRLKLGNTCGVCEKPAFGFEK